MLPKEKEVVLKRAQKVFFKAMLAGYFGDGSDTTKTKTADGETIITYVSIDGDFRVVDRYYTRPDSDCSAGTTTIFYQNLPTWWMSYSGEYPADIIPFLKEAVGSNYQKGIFNLGRGPSEYRNGDLHYHCRSNNPGTNNTFDCFSGQEVVVRFEINKETGLRTIVKGLGFHRFIGMSLI